MTWSWSPQQQAVFRWFESGTGNLIVRARAGTGKTTTIIEGIGYAPDPTILLAAFNKRIAVELEEKLRNPRARAQTLHSVGFRIVRKFWSNVRIANRNERAVALAQSACGDQAPDAILGLVAKLCTLGREMAPFATCGEDLADIAFDHDCLPDPEWEEFGWDDAAVCFAAHRAMVEAKKRPATGIDFSDMLYLPLANRWIRPTYDLVVIDEAQDMNPAQLEIARRICRGRICVVGDDRQGIYAFRGADSQSLDRMKAELGAEELGLTVTFRCGRSIVELARKLVPDYEAAPSNPPGVVRMLTEGDLTRQLVAGDVVLSRVNAPLIGHCLRALKAGTPARVEGKDVAAGLRALIRKLAKGRARNSVPAFLGRLTTWEEREIARAMKAGRDRAESKIEKIQDQADALRLLSEGVSGIGELMARIDHLFSEISSGRCVVFSSVHKAKGLEWDRVYVLDDTLRDDDLEELNIAYVAYTRAKDELVLVTKAQVDDDEQ